MGQENRQGKARNLGRGQTEGEHWKFRRTVVLKQIWTVEGKGQGREGGWGEIEAGEGK